MKKIAILFMVAGVFLGVFIWSDLIHTAPLVKDGDPVFSGGKEPTASPAANQNLPTENLGGFVPLPSVSRKLGEVIMNPEEHQLKELARLYNCDSHSPNGEASHFYSTSTVCEGYGVHGKETPYFVAQSLVDEAFAPLYLCHTPQIVLYNTLKSDCDHPSDQTHGVVGYVKVK